MWPNKGSNKSKNVADNSNKAREDSSKSESWKAYESTGKDGEFSLYDSGRTDSGFLSGANILSETCLSGEITPPSPKPESSESHSESKSYKRLDSGVDVGLSEQLSELCIEESESDPNDTEGNLTSDNVESSQNIPQTDRQTSQEQTARCLSGVPWELYFQQDEEGDTQLHIAIIQGFIEVVYSLIRMVPNPSYLDIRNDLRQTGLHLAVLTSQAGIVRRLVCAGARTDIVDRSGNSPLHLATAAGDLLCLRALTDPISVAETSTELRYSPHQRQPHPAEMNMYNYEGLTCIHLAAMGRNIDILRHLYWLGADINAREWKSGRTALHMAVESEDERLAVILVRDMGAHPGVTTYAGQTAFRLARTNPRFMRILVEIGVPQESDYSSSDEEDLDESEMPIQMLQSGFRDFHTNGGIVNATA